MILSLHQSSIPMRFGIILYSSKLVKIIEENGGHLPSSAVQDDKKRTEDVSSLVNCSFTFRFFSLYLVLENGLAF